MDASSKRHPGLKPIARDHGVGLVFAERVSKSLRASRDDRTRLAAESGSQQPVRDGLARPCFRCVG